jgi:hypothetical protein
VNITGIKLNNRVEIGGHVMTVFRLFKIAATLVFMGFFVGCATVSLNEPKNHKRVILGLLSA